MIVAGLMSGTSCDGIDVAVADLRFDGNGIRMQLLGDAELSLNGELQTRLRQVMAGESFPALTFCQLDTQIGQAFADAVVAACELLPGLALSDIDLICSHGQTLWHWEEQGRTRGTLQMGNPAWIAERTGIAVLSDLRMRDVAAGGNGAPLVALVDAMLAAGLAQEHDAGNGPAAASVGFLNLGGIANITVVQGVHGMPAEVLAYDLGPANALIDLAVARFTQGRRHFDKDGRMAARGVIDKALLADLLDHPYYQLPLPRSTGKETFSRDYLDQVLSAVEQRRQTDKGLKAEDVIATLTAQVAGSITRAIDRHALKRLIISGGGAANPVLWQAIAAGSPDVRIMNIDALGLPAGAKEAYAFAVLGFLGAHGLPGTLPARAGNPARSVLGVLTPGKQGAARMPAMAPDFATEASVLPLQLVGR